MKLLDTARLRVEQVGACLVAFREATGWFPPDVVKLAERDYYRAIR